MNLPRPRAEDTNLLLLSLVAETDPTLISRWKRVDSFGTEDFSLFAQTLRSFSNQITTPHVLTEVSNFIDQAPNYRRAELVQTLRRFAEHNAELYEEAAVLARRPEFTHLALADTGLASLSARAVIVTMDFRLAHRIASHGGHAINFNHYRSNYLLSN